MNYGSFTVIVTGMMPCLIPHWEKSRNFHAIFPSAMDAFAAKIKGFFKAFYTLHVGCGFADIVL